MTWATPGRPGTISSSPQGEMSGTASSMGASGGPLRLEIVRDPAAFMALAREWNAVLAQSPQVGNPMLTHEWFRAWWEAFGEKKELLILLLRSGGRLIGIAPLMRFWASHYGAPMRLLSLITNDHTNRADFIGVERSRECVRLVLDFLRGQVGRWDMAELNFLPADSPTVDAVRDQAGQFGLVCGEKPSYRSPFITLTGSWEKFYGGLDGHFRRNMKSREKRLAALASVEFEECRDSLDRFLPEMFAVGDRSWKGKEKTAIASTPTLRRFYTRLAELTHPKGWLSLHLLRVGGKPIAFHYSLRNDGAVYLLKTEYDTGYHTFSPGHQIQKRVLQACYAGGLREFDFLGSDMPWKREWTDRVRPHVRLLLFHGSLWSRILAFLELRAKPAVKRSAVIRRLRHTTPQALHQKRKTHATQE